MSTSRRRLGKIDTTGHVATVFVIVVAYLVTYAIYFTERNSPGGPPFSGAALAVATALGVPYLLLLIIGYSGLEPFLGRHARWVLIVVLLALVLVIEFLVAGGSVIWLISMPLVGTVVTDLQPRWQGVVIAVLLTGLGIVLYRHTGNWPVAVINVLIYCTAIVFVAVFIKMAESAGEARQKAEVLAAQLADANLRLREYAVQAEELATTQERNRLAREIHDNLGHYLTVVNVQIKAAQALMDKDPAKANAALDKAGQLSQEGLAAVRQSVSSLRESPFGHRTLPEAISRLAAETQAAGIVAEFSVEGSPRPLDPRAELTLYRAAQEGLTNVRKHARASRVDLTLSFLDPTAVSLAVCDNGIGVSGAEQAPGFGLLGIRERVRQLGGRVDVRSTPGEGYCLSLELPETPPTPVEGGAEA